MSAKVSIEDIKILRDRTGAGLMDCKNALVATESDIEKAIVWLKEKGITKMAKKAGRIAAEGRAWVLVDNDKAVIYEINAETDFVAESADFGDLTTKIGRLLLEKKPASLTQGQELVKSLLVDYTLKLGEKLDLRRFEVIARPQGLLFGSYIHHKGKIATLVEVEGGDQAFADDIAVAICANNPQYLTVADIPANAIAQETHIQTVESENDPTFKNKPEAIRQKIIEGRVNKLLAQSVFAQQEFVLDATKTMETVLKEHGAKPVKFYRFQVGEGIEKQASDFAAEVAAQLK